MIIILILTIILIIKYTNNKKDKKNVTYNTTNNSVIKENVSYIEEINYKKYYRPKRYIITLNELKFYNVLIEIAKELDLVLFTQVSLYNILETRDYLNYKTKMIFFNKIASKSIDFVLVDRYNCRIKLCIELDDSTHKQEKRIERDKFLNKLFSDLEIDFIRFKVSNYYHKEALKNRIKESMKNHYYIN